MVSGVFTIPLERLRSAYVRTNAESESIRLNQYIGSDENQLVRIAADAFLQGQQEATKEQNPLKEFNPLLFYGPTATGKTLLAIGLAARWKHAEPSRSLVAITGADFARAYATALETDSLTEFQNRYRRLDCFVLDGLDELLQKPAAQQELVFTLDQLSDNDSRIVITSRCFPLAASNLIAPLASRLCSGLTVPVQPPGPAARRQILTHLSKLHGVELSDDVLDLLSGNGSIELQYQTVPQLNQILLELITYVGRNQPIVTLESTHKLLSRAKPKVGLSLNTITNAVAKYFGVKTTDLKSPSRRQLIVRARGVAVFLARQLTDESLDNIGRQFSGRDHTTVLHAARKTELLLETDAVIQKAVNDLTHQLNHDVQR